MGTDPGGDGTGRGRVAGAVDVLALGETMALVTPTTTEPLRTAERFLVDVGGAESNVAAHLAQLGVAAGWFGRLGTDPLGHRVADILHRRGVDISRVVFDDAHPTGVYFKDPGAAVHYYRRGSAAAHLTPADVDALDLTGVRVLHLSGITPALSSDAAAAQSHAIDVARRAGVRVSFDVNHRPGLWSAEAAGPVLLGLTHRVDLVFVGRDEAQTLWGTGDVRSVRDLLAHVPHLVVKDDDIGASGFEGPEEEFRPALPVQVVEPTGAGDAFAAGYLAQLLRGGSLAARLEAGHQRAALVLSTTHDFVEETIRCRT